MKNTNNQTKRAMEMMEYISPLCEELSLNLACVICQSGPAGTETVDDIDSEW